METRLTIPLVIVLVLTHLSAYALGTATSGQDTLEQTMQREATAQAQIVAVSEQGAGAIGTVTASIEDGSGKVLLDTNPFVETDTQFSAKTAKRVAEQHTNISLEQVNVEYSFSIDGDYIGGPSAGAAMTVATIAAITGRQVDTGTAITGTIRPDGRIGNVGSVLEKSFTAGKAGLDQFLVPQDQEELVYYETVVDRRPVAPGFVFEDVQYVPQRVRLNNLTTNEFGMETVAVSTIEDVVTHMLE